MSINLNVQGNTQPLEAAVQAAVNRIRKTPIKITVDDKGATQPLGNMKRGADEFSKSMEAANARIIAFGASMAIINGVADGFKALVKNVVEVEKALADINVVMNLSTANLEKFSNGLFKTAKETGAAFNVAAEAATEYARQGLTMEESLKRTRDALILTRLTGMDSANAVKALTAAMNTYGDQIKDTTQLVSKFAAVDVKFAVSAEDFADAISRTGQAAKSAGVDIDELVGLVTAAQQKTARGGKVIGNSFKTIFTRIGRTDTLNQLENLGIAVRDLEGNTIGARRILTDLANTFDHLTESQKAQIAQTVGGVFQINILKAVLSDAAKQNGILANATQISAGATTEAIDKNDQLRQTMSAMATETGIALKELSAQIGEIMLAPGMEKVLNVFKGLAEGANEMLGGGESTGSDFAQGFLKGLGNIITGPGLVVISAVFIKLFAKALVYANQSLQSLIGVTSEAHKQKAIQTSLVTLFGQNAAISKEMLRTDISRTEKEKIILGLLKAQVVEANMLNSVSKSVAASLYTKGYNASLAPRKGRAGGHIPNFADPEREQAARGGYAAGSIRSMNMPGEGSVIYNSAEKVKNFKGMSQPAIMPPKSSKAGENYQQAFGSIHGFDPYAAGGYIPNFKKIKPRTSKFTAKQGRVQYGINQNSSNYVGLAASRGSDQIGNYYYVVPGVADSGVYQARSDGSPPKGFTDIHAPAKGKKTANPNQGKGAKVAFDFYTLDESDKKRGSKRFEDQINEKLQNKGFEVTNQILNSLSLGDTFSMDKSNMNSDLPKSKMAVVSGHIFEAVAKSIIRGVGETDKITEDQGARIDLPRNKELYKLFGVPGSKGRKGAEAKINTNIKNAKSFARKIYDVRFGKAGAPNLSKTSDLNKGILSRKDGRLFVGDKPWSSSNEEQTTLLRKAGFKSLQSGKFSRVGLNSQLKSHGYIPNFANPLSDAIGREKEAGVPVSKIRIGSHSALMNKSNPIGLGVTNTDDEPNGLKDVFGAANGYVPNYAPEITSSDVVGYRGSGAQSQTESNAKKYNKAIAGVIKRFETGRVPHKKMQEMMQKLGNKYNVSSSAQDRVAKKTNQLIGTTEKLKAATQRAARSVGLQNASSRFAGTRAGRMIGSTGGQMGLMMGLPMAAGFAQDAIGGTAGAATGGFLQGAGSGAAMGMMFGPLGTAIGATVGGLYGLVDGLGKAEEAAIKKAKDDLDYSKSMGSSLVSLFSDFPEAKKHLKDFREGYNRLNQEIKKEDSKTINVAKGFDPLTSSTIYKKEKDPEAQGKVKVMNEIMNTNLDSKLSDALRALPSDYTFSAKGAEAGSEFKGTGKEYAKELEKADVSRKKVMFESFMAGERKAENESADLRKEEVRGLIVKLNHQKAMLVSQQESALAQLRIKDKYRQISENLDFQEKVMGGAITEQQKAQIKYKKALNSAAEKLDSSLRGADSSLKEGLMTLVKRSPSMQSSVRSDLAKKMGIKASEKNRISRIDVTKPYSKMSGQELVGKLKEIDGVSPQDLAAIESLVYKKRSDETLARQSKISQAGSAKRVLGQDLYVATENKIIKDLERKNRMSSEGLQSSQKIRGFTEQVAAARRLNAVGPGYQTGRERESFAMSEKRFKLESKITTLEENQKDKLAGLDTKKKRDELKEKRLEGMVTGQITLKSEADWEEYDALLNSQEERKKNLDEIEQKIKNINAETKTEISSAQELLEKEKERLKLKREYETGPGAMRNGARDAQKRIVEQAETMEFRLGGELTNQFRNGLVDGMQAAINKADDLSDVMNNIAMNFLGAIQQAYLGKAADAIVGALPFSSGGGVRKYSKGGGVPAMVTNGEYVMGGDAVKKYGGGFMHRLNAGGKLPGYSTGGKPDEPQPGSALAANFGGGEGYNTGRRYQSQAMSGFFYSGQSGNLGLQEDTQYTKGIIQERMRKEAEKKAKKRALMQMLVGTALSVGIGSMVSSGLEGLAESGALGEKSMLDSWGKSSGIDSAAVNQTMLETGMSRTEAMSINQPFENDFDFGSIVKDNYSPFSPTSIQESRAVYRGGKINGYANGGHIAGKSGIDQIPAMLSEGEYVIRASSARQLGKPMLDRINAGKFNDGGAVTPLTENSETGTSGGNTNNINITVNMDKGSGKSEKKDDKAGANPKDSSEDQEKSTQLAEKVKQQVISVIMDEQRPGGLLSD